MRRFLAYAATTLAAVLTVTVLTVTPAHAGGWAVTLLDPVPDRWESGRGYTVGFWVLQHGFHPFEGDLGEVALRLVGEDGTTVSFPAVELSERAHYAAAVAVPHDGTWEVVGVQGIFADYHVGTLTVPGALTVLGVPAPLRKDQTEKFWPGPIRPPAVPVDQSRDPFGPIVASREVAEMAAAPVAHVDPSPIGRTARTPLIVSVGVLLMAGAAGLWLWRRRPTHR